MIKLIHARQILDSRGNPTVEVDLKTSKYTVRASVPSGASTGAHEALELRDKKKAFAGAGVGKAVNNINTILNRKLRGMDCRRQENIDNLMINLDGTKNKSRLGANAILGVSIAVCKAGALENNVPLYQHISNISGRKNIMLPVPSMNIINGGVHAGNKLDFQEFMIFPSKARSFSNAMQIGSEIYHELKSVLKKKYGQDSTNVGDEGGFAPPIQSINEPFKLILDAAGNLGYKNKIKINIDAAASEFYKKKYYLLENKKRSPEEMENIYGSLTKKYPLASIEDPFDQDDFDSFANLMKRLKTQIVGDDLLVTNPKRVENAIETKAANALLLKINQIGSITEAIKAANISFDAGWNVMVSHRSGETTEDFIADLAVGLGAGQIKSGAPCRGERLSKYNQLLRIEESLGKKARFARNIL